MPMKRKADTRHSAIYLDPIAYADLKAIAEEEDKLSQGAAVAVHKKCRSGWFGGQGESLYGDCGAKSASIKKAFTSLVCFSMIASWSSDEAER